MSALEQVAAEWGRLLSLLVGRFRDLDLAEEALATALERAARTWPETGEPDQPAAWVLAVARRCALDELKSREVRRRRLPDLVVEHEAWGQRHRTAEEDRAMDDWADADTADDRARMLFMTCHPALAADAQLALALRFVLGLPTKEVARLCLVSEPTMAARLTRAKHKIVASGIPFAVPPAARLAERTDAVARAIYLGFTAGYAPGASATLLNLELADEALRLARLLVHLVPHQATPRALLALLLAQHARRDARVDAGGRLVLLDDQDRIRWRHDEIAEAASLLHGLRPQTTFGAELDLQARIGLLHDTAPTPEATDWASISALYARLEELTGNPVVRLNRAVAVAEADGPEAGLRLLEGLDDDLPRSHRLPAVRGELLARAKRPAAAASQLRLALERCTNDVERAHLASRLTDLDQT